MNNEINNWNVGAMLCPVLWGLGNGIDWPLIALAIISLCNPLTALLACIWFGINCNKWVAESTDYASASTFRTVQRRCAIAIISLYAVLLNMTKSAVSHQLKVLRTAKLVRAQKKR